MYDIKETFRAKSVPDALELLRTHPGAIPVCGGTDVMIHLKERKLRQATLVGIMDIASLQGIYANCKGKLDTRKKADESYPRAGAGAGLREVHE